MKCANCGHDEHIIVILNGTKMTKCIKCQVYQEAKEEPNPNRSERWGGIGSLILMVAIIVVIENMD